MYRTAIDSRRWDWAERARITHGNDWTGPERDCRRHVQQRDRESPCSGSALPGRHGQERQQPATDIPEAVPGKATDLPEAVPGTRSSSRCEHPVAMGSKSC